MKKMTALVLALVIACCSLSLASAETRGVFGELAEDEYADERLAELDRISELLGASLTTPEGMYFEVSQGRFTGDQVIIAYRICIGADLITLHEGAPEALEWDQVIEDWIMGDLQPTGFADVDKENGWMDGKGQRWLESPYMHIGNSLGLEAGKYLDFTGGTEVKLADGSIIGWRECVIPEEKQKDTMGMEFFVPVLYGTAVKFQDYSTLKENFGVEYQFDIPITLYHYKENQ